MLNVTLGTAAFAECWPPADLPEDVEGAPMGAQGCLVEAPLTAGCEGPFGLTEDGCCPTFREVLHSSGWAGQTLSQPADGTRAMHCVGREGDELDFLRVYEDDDLRVEYQAFFATDGTMIALYRQELVGYSNPGYTGEFEWREWCCGGEFNATSLWWGDRAAVERAYEIDCVGPTPGNFEYTPAEIAGSVDADPGCDTPPEPAVPDDHDKDGARSDSCGCRTAPASGGARVGLFGLFMAVVGIRGRTPPGRGAGVPHGSVEGSWEPGRRWSCSPRRHSRWLEKGRC